LVSVTGGGGANLARRKNMGTIIGTLYIIIY
jgi:hypothetical protein